MVLEPTGVVKHLVNYLTGTEITVITLLASSTEGTANRAAHLSGEADSVAKSAFRNGIWYEYGCNGLAVGKGEEGLYRTIVSCSFMGWGEAM